MIDQQPFGSVDGRSVSLYSLTNREGLCAKITDYGGILTELHLPDRAGRLADVVLGFADLAGYLAGHPYFGATVGRVGNRISNARFELDGKTVQLSANKPPNHMHGGFKGFDKQLWDAEATATPEGPALRLHYVSADGEEGYPGRLDVVVTYTLSDDNALRFEVEATTDRPTIVNIVNHSYWNLGDETVLDHEVRLFASRYTPAGADLVPTGTVALVAGTAFDFTAAKPIGRDLAAAGGDPVGFDANFVVDGDPHALRPVARMAHPGSGRVVELEADQPGVQFYTGNSLHGATSGKGRRHVQYGGCCFETQCFPDAINKQAWRDQVILRPDRTYRHTQIARFGIV